LGGTTITASQAGNGSYNPATPVDQILTLNLPHNADYAPVGTPDWEIDTFEASRVLGYWRAGAYHIDISTVDKYEAGL
jgi:hypothetical protein